MRPLSPPEYAPRRADRSPRSCGGRRPPSFASFPPCPPQGTSQPRQPSPASTGRGRTSVCGMAAIFLSRAGRHTGMDEHARKRGQGEESMWHAPPSQHGRTILQRRAKPDLLDNVMVSSWRRWLARGSFVDRVEFVMRASPQGARAACKQLSVAAKHGGRVTVVRIERFMASACGQPRCPMAAWVVCPHRPLRVRSVIGVWVAWWRGVDKEASSRSGTPTFSTTRTSDHGERLQRISRGDPHGATRSAVSDPVSGPRATRRHRLARET